MTETQLRSALTQVSKASIPHAEDCRGRLGEEAAGDQNEAAVAAGLEPGTGSRRAGEVGGEAAGRAERRRRLGAAAGAHAAGAARRGGAAAGAHAAGAARRGGAAAGAHAAGAARRGGLRSAVGAGDAEGDGQKAAVGEHGGRATVPRAAGTEGGGARAAGAAGGARVGAAGAAGHGALPKGAAKRSDRLVVAQGTVVPAAVHGERGTGNANVERGKCERGATAVPSVASVGDGAVGGAPEKKKTSPKEFLQKKATALLEKARKKPESAGEAQPVASRTRAAMANWPISSRLRHQSQPQQPPVPKKKGRKKE